MLITYILMASGAYLVRFLDLSDWGFLSQWQYWIGFALMFSALQIARHEGKKAK